MIGAWTCSRPRFPSAFRSTRPEENPMRVGNQLGISLPLAVWLLHDEYDYIDRQNYISATGLMKPLRQIVLPKRIPPDQLMPDVSEFIARKLGHAIHDSIE